MVTSSVVLVLVIILIMGLVAGIVALANWQSPAKIVERAEKKQKSLLQNATPGEAKIIEVGASYTSRGSTDVALRLEVTPQFGESFNAITVWSVEPVHLAEIQAGKSIPVKIVEMQAGKSNAKGFKSIFPDAAWAKLYGYAQEFTEADMKNVDG